VVSGTEPIRIAWPREVQDQQYSVQVEAYRSIIRSQVVRYYNIQAVAHQEGEGGSFPLWVDVQKLCNMYVLSLSWNFFVSNDKYIARPSSKEPR